MKKLLLFVHLILSAHILYAQQKILQRVYSQGFSKHFIASGNNYLLTGHHNNASLAKGFLTEVDSVGNVIWGKEYTDSIQNCYFNKVLKLSNGNI